MDKVTKAIEFASEAHDGMVRKKDKTPYILHPLEAAVIVGSMTDDRYVISASVLHDVVEDTNYTLEDIQNMGFPQQILDALALLTHDDGVPYMEYVAANRKNPNATAVKLADLRHNSDLTRLDRVDEKALRRREKYLKAIALLEE